MRLPQSQLETHDFSLIYTQHCADGLTRFRRILSMGHNLTEYRNPKWETRVLSYPQKPLLLLLPCLVSAVCSWQVTRTHSDGVGICSLIPLQPWRLPGHSFVSAPGLFLILILILLPWGSDLAPDPICSLDR